MTRKITFSELARLLEGLAFVQTTQPTHILFEHLASETLVVLRVYQPREIMDPMDLAVVRKTLDERGLMSVDSFERFTRKKPA